VPDYLFPERSDGMAYLAIGRGEAVRREALARGYAFLPDAREPRQHVMGFVYRNIVPSADFHDIDMFQGRYLPESTDCTRTEFLEGGCGW
jgi:hypothetical protein